MPKNARAALVLYEIFHRACMSCRVTCARSCAASQIFLPRTSPIYSTEKPAIDSLPSFPSSLIWYWSLCNRKLCAVDHDLSSHVKKKRWYPIACSQVDWKWLVWTGNIMGVKCLLAILSCKNKAIIYKLSPDCFAAIFAVDIWCPADRQILLLQRWLISKFCPLTPHLAVGYWDFSAPDPWCKLGLQIVGLKKLNLKFVKLNGEYKLRWEEKIVDSTFWIQ